MKPLVVIPARGGSKRLPGKNIKPLFGKPLIHYTIEAARAVFDDESICVSTNEEFIKTVAERTGLKVPFLRPNELATDKSDTHSVLLHAYQYYKYKRNLNADTIILLQPTSPFRNSKHITEALKLYTPQLDMVVSVKETKSNPYFVLYEENENGFIEKSKKGDFLRKQDCPKVFELNGAIYIINIASLIKQQVKDFIKVIPYVMEENKSIDIDTALDFRIAETIIAELRS